jgi:site-specific recombinase XerD
MASFKGKLIQKIHPFEVEKYKKNRRDAGKAPATVNREIETLKNMMTIAVEWGYLQSNPIQSVKKYKLNNERDWILDTESEEKLLEECDKRPQRKGGKYLRDLVELALYTGMRQAEIFNLKKGDVHLTDQFIFVSDSKNGETRNVPLNKTALAILEPRINNKKSDYIFCKNDGKKINELTNAFWTAVSEANLERFEIDKTGKKNVFGSASMICGTHSVPA